MIPKPPASATTKRDFQVQPPVERLPERYTAGKRYFRATIQFVDDLPAWVQYAIAAAFTLLIFAIDATTSSQFSIRIFYIVPITMLAWHRSWTAAQVFVVLAAVLWFLADALRGSPDAADAVQYWNALVRLGLFLSLGFTLSQLRNAVNEEQRLARTDSLTGVPNRRSFLEITAREVIRQQRYNQPLTIVFLDCDNFKEVNDEHGHAAGDDLLRDIAACITNCLRAVDTVARLGGDEFAILLPECDERAASVVSSKVREALRLAVGDYGVTFSVGIVTYLKPPDDVDEIIQMADQTMYDAKKTGKNASRHRVIRAAMAEGTNA